MADQPSPYVEDGLAHLATDDRKTLCGRFVAYQHSVSISTDIARLMALAVQYERVTCPTCAAAIRTAIRPSWGERGPQTQAEYDDLCPDCGTPQDEHLTQDECDARGIDTRDGRGCAVITRVLSINADQDAS